MVLWLAACVGEEDPGTQPVTFYEDVRPLLAQSCARCHNPTGLGAGGDFLDYENAAAWAPVMVDRIDRGEMPPPAADPACHPYQDADLYQADPALRDVLARWVEQGVPAGDEASAPAVSVPEPRSLPRRDLEMKAPAPVVPQFDGGNEYRCFNLGAVDSATYITGLEFLIDHPEISHHALLFIDADGGNAANVTDPASQSWPCSVNDMPGQMLHAWAPSNGAAILPEGAALFVPGGAELVLQMHYFDRPGDDPADQPGYAFTTSDTLGELMFLLPAGPEGFTIPAGDPSYSESFLFPLAPFSGGGLIDLSVWGVLPHMHLLGTSYDFHTESADGDKCLSRADDYDFSMQPTYWFEEPVHVGGSDTLSITCTWDNSAENPLQVSDPPVDVHWGENTQDEMCYGFFYVTFAF